MIDYDFYVNSYLGTAIPEKAFASLAGRARDALAAIGRKYRILPADEVSEKMALCAMAEELHAAKPGITSATVGSVSMRYSQSKSLQQRLLEKARIYLDIYRGVNQWKLP